MRKTVAGILLVLGVVLAPVAVAAAWARSELVDTDSFVATAAPLIDEPDVQQLVHDKALAAIQQNVNLSGIADKIGSYNLPPQASDALDKLAGSVTDRIRGVVSDSITRVVSSETFATVWREVLREGHAQAVAAIDSGADEGLQLQLGPVVDRVKADLLDRGFAFASAIPKIDAAVPLLDSSSMASARTAYNITDSVGFWLPWVVGTLLIAGLVAARDRLGALRGVASGTAVAFGLLWGGLWLGQQVFIARVAPDLMSQDAAGTIFNAVTTDLRAISIWTSASAVVAAIALFVARRRRPDAPPPPAYGE